MGTVIIDRSLCGARFKEVTSKIDVYMYAQSLIESGADYVELDLAALSRAPQPSGAEKYIFRIEHADGYKIANALPFSYALIPLKFSYLTEKINIPVVLEIKTGDADILTLLRIVSESIDLTKVSMLRLVGDFKIPADDFAGVLDKIKMLYAVPIDICPLNTSLGALMSAVAAYNAGVSSVTLSFGNSSNFAPLEEFLICMATVYKKIISKSYISGICKAAVMSDIIGDIEITTLKMLMKRYQLSPQRVELADGPPMQFNPWKGRAARPMSLMERRLYEMEVEEELSEEILDKLKECGVDLYANDEKKGELN